MRAISSKLFPSASSCSVSSAGVDWAAWRARRGRPCRRRRDGEDLGPRRAPPCARRCPKPPAVPAGSRRLRHRSSRRRRVRTTNAATFGAVAVTRRHSLNNPSTRGWARAVRLRGRRRRRGTGSPAHGLHARRRLDGRRRALFFFFARSSFRSGAVSHSGCCRRHRHFAARHFGIWPKCVHICRCRQRLLSDGAAHEW